MAFTFEQLLAGMSYEAAMDEIKDHCERNGYDTSQWKVGSLAYHALATPSFYYAMHSQKLSDAIKLVNNQTSSGSALTMLAESYFDNKRYEAETAVGLVIVTGSYQAVLPKTFTPRTLKITDGSYIFSNQNTFTISNTIPYVTESFIADKPGAEYNIETNATLTPVETNLGIFLSNPPATTGISSSWLTTFGSDRESDRQLILRNQLKYSTLQTGDFTEDRVKYLCLSGSLSNTYVSIDDSQYRGAGTVNVYLSNDTTTATSASVAAAQLIMNKCFFGNSNGDLITCYAATPYTFDKTITIYYDSRIINPATIKSLTYEACDNWIATIPIGGNDYLPYASNIASISDLSHDLENIKDVVKVNISSSTDISLNINEKLTSPTDWSTVITFVRLNNLFTVR